MQRPAASSALALLHALRGEIVQAREQIMTSVRALMDSGEFKVARAGEELVT